MLGQLMATASCTNKINGEHEWAAPVAHHATRCAIAATPGASTATSAAAIADAAVASPAHAHEPAA